MPFDWDEIIEEVEDEVRDFKKRLEAIERKYNVFAELEIRNEKTSFFGCLTPISYDRVIYVENIVLLRKR